MSVILVCGLNGSGKTTFGMKLADRLKYDFLNDEDYYFFEDDKNNQECQPKQENGFVLSPNVVQDLFPASTPR